MVEKADMVRAILTDLNLTLPPDLEWSVDHDETMVYVHFRREKRHSTCGTPLDFSQCHLAEKVISDLQDFLADVYSVWWPQVGRHRLTYEIDCQDDRPRLIFRL